MTNEFPDEIEQDEFKPVYDACERLKNQLDEIQQAIEKKNGDVVDKKTKQVDKTAGQLRMSTIRAGQKQNKNGV